ncbi:MAG: hypothetical protein HUU29_06485 [Planctomycetaceae bacterium]|nr:hypothetical protein [Planctomycetaceae bacterium]
MKTWILGCVVVAGLSAYSPAWAEDPANLPPADELPKPPAAPAVPADVARVELSANYKTLYDKLVADPTYKSAPADVKKLFEYSRDLREYAGAEEVFKLFKEKNPGRQAMGEVEAAYARCMFSSGDIQKAKEAVDAVLACNAALADKMALLQQLAAVQSILLEDEAVRAAIKQMKTLGKGDKEHRETISSLKAELVCDDEAKACEMTGYPLRGTVFPGFVAEDLDGNTIDTKKYEGKVVLYDFWATY